MLKGEAPSPDEYQAILGKLEQLTSACWAGNENCRQGYVERCFEPFPIAYALAPFAGPVRGSEFSGNFVDVQKFYSWLLYCNSWHLSWDGTLAPKVMRPGPVVRAPLDGTFVILGRSKYRFEEE